MYHVPLAVQCKYRCSDEGGEDGEGRKESEILIGWENGREWRLPGLLYANDLVLCGDQVEVELFTEVFRRRLLKDNVGTKSKEIVLNGEEGFECEVHVDGFRLEHVSKLKYLGSVLDESGTEEAEYSRKVAGGRYH